MSGSGVLLGGEMASGVITILGFSCRRKLIFLIYLFILQNFIDVESMIYLLSTDAKTIIHLQTDACVDFVLPNILQKQYFKLLNNMRCKFVPNQCGSAFLCTSVFLNLIHSQPSQPLEPQRGLTDLEARLSAPLLRHFEQRE